MGMLEFTVREYIPDYVEVGDEYKRIEAEKIYKVYNYDDLQNLLMTIIDFSKDDVKFKVARKEVEA